MFECIRHYDQIIKTGNKWSHVPAILAAGTTVLALLQTVLVVEMRELTLEKIVLFLSYQISEDIFLWTSSSLNVSSNSLKKEYGTDVNSVTVGLSAIKITQDFGFNMRQGLVWDLLLVVTLNLQIWMNLFEDSVQTVIIDVPDESSEEGKKLDLNRVAVWNMYKDIHGVFEAVNDVFEPLVLCFHATNILRYALFMERCICSQSATLIIFIQILYDVVKSEMVYILASNMTYQVI